MTAHAKLGASSAHRWMACPGSVALSEKAPKPLETIAAREGTIAHELAAYCLTNGLCDAADAVDSVPTLAELDKMFLGQGDAKRDEMVAGVNKYLAPIYELMAAHKDTGAALYVETRFSLDHVGPDMFGTCDAVVLIPSARKIVVFDLKYGAGTFVDVIDNPQLQYYALGALRVFQGAGYEGLKVRDVELAIVQPRAGADAVRRVALDRADLFEFKARLADAAAAARAPNAPLVDGEHCKFCPAKVICPKLTEAALEAARDDFGAATKAGISPAEMGKRLRIAAAAEMWAKAVDEFAKAEALAGRMPSGFEWKVRAGNREWSAEATPEKLAVAAGNLCAVTETKVRSPAQIEKDIGKAELAKRFATLLSRKPATQYLGPIGDGKPRADDYALEGF